MKITENKKGRCTGCCAAALFAGLDGTYDFLLVAPVFLHPAEKDAKNHLTNCYGGGYYIRKAGSTKKGSEHAKKIVRLILMSNISRRKFLKGAGVAALAVAAAGVLAGCSGNDVPSIPGVTAKDITVNFVDYDGKLIDSDRKENVPVDQYNMNSSEVTAPKGYVIAIVGDSKIDWDNQTVTFTVKEAPKATINYYCVAEGHSVGEEVLYVDEGVTYVNTSTFKKVPAGYELVMSGDLPINDGYVYAEVRKAQ